MKRRKFIKTTGSIAVGGMTIPTLLGNIVNASELERGTDIKSLFESNREDALTLTDDVFHKCILEKILPPVEPLKHNWVYPGGPYYKGQWIWDSMFVVDLLSILPGKKQVIRDIFQNYWDFQDRWNRVMPEYAHDMVTVAIKTAPQEVRQFSHRYLYWPGVLNGYISVMATRNYLNNALTGLKAFMTGTGVKEI